MKLKDSIVIILVFIVAVALGIFVGVKITENKGSFKEAENNNSTVEKTNLKINSDRDWVYDAEYEKDVNADAYKTNYNEYYAKNIVVPFININSSYANSSNKEIKRVLDDAVIKYNEGIANKTTYIDECSYEQFINNDKLSIILTYGVGGTSVVHSKYYVYNFDLNTGNELSYKDAYKLAGFNSDNIDEKVEQAITATMTEKMSNFTIENYPSGTNFDTYNSASINNYKEDVSNNTVKYFLSANNQLNIIVTLNIPADNGYFDTIITIK